MASESSDSDNEIAQKKKKYNVKRKVFQESWLQDPVLGLFVEKVDDLTKVKCTVCNKIMAAGKSEIQKHADGKTHTKKMRAINFHQPIDSFSKSEDSHERQVKIAELKLSCFFAEHNVAIQVVEHLLPLLKDIFKDSKVAQNMNLGRTKCSEILKNVLCSVETNETISNLKNTKFSVLVDESTDIGDNKNLCILVRYCHGTTGKTITQLLELVKLNASEGSAEKLYNEFKLCLTKHKIPLDNIIGVASDGCNTMVGIRNSFYTHLRTDVPNAILISCICHSAAIVASRACEELPRSSEELLRATYSYVSGSAKRCSILMEMQEFFHMERKKMLKLANTRWLSRHACVVRLLENYSALQHYFQLAVVEDKLLSAETILQQLNNVCNKAYLYFLKYALNIFNSFNALFQSRTPKIHVLYSESNTLMKQLCQNFMKLEIVLEQNLGSVNIKYPNYYLPLEKVYLGAECTEFIKTIPHEAAHEIRIKCLNFYVTAAFEIQKRLPLRNDIFRAMSFINPDVAFSGSSSDTEISNIILHFKDLIDADQCEIEWRSLMVSLDGNKINELKKLPIDEMWHEIYNMKNFENTFAFKNIATLAKLVLTLPHSNAEAERIFSIITDVKNKKRNRMGAEVLNAICVIRSALQNKMESCYEYKITKNHLDLCNTKNTYSFK